MKTILVPVDFSDATAPAVEQASRLAEAMSARLVLLHVAAPEPEFIGYDPGPPSVRQQVAEELTGEHRRLQALERSIEGRGLDVTALTVQGYPVEKILDEAGRRRADLIVMGSHGHGMLRTLLVGSVTEGVLRDATIPVLIVPVTRAL
jgi:nucleotide-binding universal stress UspA family protein